MGRPKSSLNPVVTSIKLDESTRNALKSMAADSGISFGELLRRILDGYVEGRAGVELDRELKATRSAALENVRELAAELQRRLVLLKLS